MDQKQLAALLRRAAEHFSTVSHGGITATLEVTVNGFAICVLQRIDNESLQVRRFVTFEAAFASEFQNIHRLVDDIIASFALNHAA